MARKLNRFTVDEQRLIVLKTVAEAGPVTEMQLNRFIQEYALMSYFDMMMALEELCRGGQAVRKKGRLDDRYAATEAGYEAVRFFDEKIPAKARTLLEEQCPVWRERFMLEENYQSDIRTGEQGDYVLTLSVSEAERDMMKLELVLPDRDTAQELAARWPRDAARVYGLLMRGLSGEDV